MDQETVSRRRRWGIEGPFLSDRHPAEANGMESVAQACLALYCEIIPGVAGGIAVLESSDGESAAEIAHWPESTSEPSELTKLATAAMSQERAVTGGRRDDTGANRAHSHVAVPFKTEAGLRGAVALKLGPPGPAASRGIIDLLQLATVRLAAGIRADAAREQLGAVLDLVGMGLELDGLGPAVTALCTELATRLDCERVSIGFVERRDIHVEAVSHSARFDERAQLLRHVAAAMNEAADQDTAIAFPTPAGESVSITREHENLIHAHGAGSVCTVPLASSGRVVGAITFERPAGQGIDPDTIQYCKDVAALLGPILDLKRKSEAGLLNRGREFASAQLSRLKGPGHTGLKLAIAAVVFCALSLGFVKIEYRITAEATLEGRVQRAIVSGLDGYIAEAHARAGDVVRKEQILGKLDQRDLSLERQKWFARREQLRREHREALAGHDRTQVNILSAKAAQADAQLRLVDEKLRRTQLRAPFDGVVVKGDLDQSLGSPVEKGQVLFEIAPLDGYRIILKVDERDISAVARGAPGQLALTALPGRRLPLTVERLTPVATAEEGRNYFRVEARLDEPIDSLRPGMQGVGKLRAGRQPLGWIWTHQLFDWLRLCAWSWWP